MIDKAEQVRRAIRSAAAYLAGTERDPFKLWKANQIINAAIGEGHKEYLRRLFAPILAKSRKRTVRSNVRERVSYGGAD